MVEQAACLVQNELLHHFDDGVFSIGGVPQEWLLPAPLALGEEGVGLEFGVLLEEEVFKVLELSEYADSALEPYALQKEELRSNRKQFIQQEVEEAFEGSPEAMVNGEDGGEERPNGLGHGRELFLQEGEEVEARLSRVTTDELFCNAVEGGTLATEQLLKTPQAQVLREVNGG